MAGASSKSSGAPKARKRVEAETSSLKRAKNGSAFTRCDECNKDVPVVLIDMHNCSLDSKIKMTLESQVVENAAEAKKQLSTKKSASTAEAKKQSSTKKSNSSGLKEKSSKGKKTKDPNAPKRPASSFFLFMEDFRKEYKEANPDAKAGPAVAKEGGEKWKVMSDEEKKVYVDKAAELKEEYEKAMEKYNAEKEGSAEVDEAVVDAEDTDNADQNAKNGKENELDDSDEE